MLIRQLVVAALAAGAACAAQADPIPAAGTASGTPAVLSGWTGANGTDVLSSGVLSGSNLSLVGGLSYSEASKVSGSQGSATLADVLMGKASASVGQTANGQTQLFYQQGIDGMYLLGSGHGMLAALLGNGVSVVGSSGGVIVSKGINGAGGYGGGAAVGGIGGGGGGVAAGGGGGSAMGNLGGGGAGGAGGAGGVGAGAGGAGGVGAGAGGMGGSGGFEGQGGGIVALPDQLPPLDDIGNGGIGNTGGLEGTPGPKLPDVGPSGTVPEPSSIALMMAGLLGASSLVRRRRR